MHNSGLYFRKMGSLLKRELDPFFRPNERYHISEKLLVLPEIDIDVSSCQKALDYIITEHITPEFAEFIQTEMAAYLDKDDSVKFLYSQILEMTICKFFFKLAQ
jgi:hypothetical protein